MATQCVEHRKARSQRGQGQRDIEGGYGAPDPRNGSERHTDPQGRGVGHHVESIGMK